MGLFSVYNYTILWDYSQLNGFLMPLVKAVKGEKDFFKLWRKEIPNIFNIFTLFYIVATCNYNRQKVLSWFSK